MDVLQLWVDQHAALRRAARHMARDNSEADDLLQHAFVKAMEHLDTLAAYPPAQVQGWMMRTMRNKLIDLRRRERRWLPEDSAPEPIYEANFSNLHAVELLEELPDVLAEVVRLRWLEGMNSVEIGARLDLPPPTVRTRLRTALLLLRRKQKGGTGT